MNRIERIAALVANPHNFVKSAKALEAMTDEELTTLEGQLKTAADKATEDAAALKAAQDKANATPAQMTEEQFLAVAPQTIRDLVASKRAQDEAAVTALVATLKAAQSAFSEDDLKVMPLAQLRKMAAAMKVNEPAVDFSLQGMPRVAEGGFDFTPPDPYAVKK